MRPPPPVAPSPAQGEQKTDKLPDHRRQPCCCFFFIIETAHRGSGQEEASAPCIGTLQTRSASEWAGSSRDCADVRLRSIFCLWARFYTSSPCVQPLQPDRNRGTINVQAPSQIGYNVAHRGQRVGGRAAFPGISAQFGGGRSVQGCRCQPTGMEQAQRVIGSFWYSMLHTAEIKLLSLW
ncbi:hypothetical protein ATANTOWER_016959 [Ataeniobius toweri]|uniref:Uncharacterized protein n=1 Tax=Ataeniobius toweri TaxID=208326 RepID=A0ABU7B236_9TELE|nr:hypothetical protein [Ataeniobius toweri]